MKKCSTCKKQKLFEDFNKYTKSPDGFAYICKDCQKKNNDLAYKRTTQFLDEYREPDENYKDATIRHFCENGGKEKWQRYLDKNTRPGSNGCILWEVGLNGGYGQVTISVGVGKGCSVRAHRLAYAVEFGYDALENSKERPDSDTYTIDHLCKTTNCVNPYHMANVTHGENVSRRWIA